MQIMNEEKQPLDLYLREIQHVRPLTADEVRQLEQLVLAGKEAQQRLVQAHLALVAELAKEYAENEGAQLELTQVGNVALIHAAETFGTTSEAHFSVHAEQQIREAIKQVKTQAR